MKPITLLFIFPALLLLVSCSSNERPVYQGAEYYKNLEIPPDLTKPDTTDEVRVPKPTDDALQRFRDNNKLETVITPKFDGVRMVSYAGSSWLEIDNSVDVVWPKIKEFFEGEGIELVEERPLLGYVETEWTEKLSPEKGYFKSLFQKIEPDQKHKFRVRVEPFDNGSKTRLYIAHSRIERQVRGEYGDEFYWVTLPSDVETERELIARMALFAGLTPEQRQALLENYRPYSSLVKIERDDTTSLTMKGSKDFVWHRTMRALDRMRMQQIVEDPSTSSITFVAKKLDDKELGIKEEEDDLSKSSWIVQLFTGDDDKNIADHTFRILLADTGGSIKLTIRDLSDTVTTDEDGNVIGSARIEQLRNVLVKYLE